MPLASQSINYRWIPGWPISMVGTYDYSLLR
eukprot:SAG31_NODE_38726_length_293_cov_13.185567_1_plen_30_part_01